jgi:hypothetical protein
MTNAGFDPTSRLGLCMALELWSWHRAVMALAWPWVYALALRVQATALVLASRVVAITLRFWP